MSCGPNELLAHDTLFMPSHSTLRKLSSGSVNGACMWERKIHVHLSGLTKHFCRVIAVVHPGLGGRHDTAAASCAPFQQVRRCMCIGQRRYAKSSTQADVHSPVRAGTCWIQVQSPNCKKQGYQMLMRSLVLTGAILSPSRCCESR
jgi:hypothetical protein